MKQIIKNRENQIVTILSVLTVILAISPLISRYCINGHDLEYHLLRIEALKEDILIGHPFAKINTLFFGGAGYASSLFYSDFLLYIPALLRVVGVSIDSSYHIFAALCVILCYLSTYYCVYKISKSKYAGVAAAMLITLCPYHMDDIMVRSAVGEYMAFIFVPFVIYGIYNVLYENMDKPWIFAIGFGTVLLSHTATLIMCVIFCVAAFLIKIKVFIKNPKIILKLAITTIVTMMATSFLWMPMLEQFATGQFPSFGGIDMLDAAVDFSQVLSQVFPTVGLLLVLLAIPRVFISKKDYEILDYADWMYIGGAAFAVMATNLLPWDRLYSVLSFVQFPWRFFLISSILFAASDAIYIMCFVKSLSSDDSITDKNMRIWSVAISVIFILSGTLAMVHQSENAQGYYDYSDDYYSYKPYTGMVIGGEWLPENVDSRDRILELSEIMPADNGEHVPFERWKGAVYATIEKEYEYVDAPLIFYKGYVASITDASGVSTSLNVTGEGDNGMSRVFLSGRTGNLEIHYGITTVQLISVVMSVIGVALLVAGIVVIKRRNGSEKIEK